MTKVFDLNGGNINVGTLRTGPGVSSLGDISGGAQLSIGQAYSHGYSDYGFRVENGALGIGGGEMVADGARFGLDLRRDADTNLQDLVLDGHDDADIRIGPGVRGDMKNVSARQIYNMARGRTLTSSVKLKSHDMAVNTTQEQRLREYRLAQAKMLSISAALGIGLEKVQDLFL